MPKATLSGSLLAGPQEGADTGTIPSGTISDPLGFSTGEELSYAVSTGLMVRNVATVGFLALYGVGSADAVTKAKLAYFRTSGVLTVKLTFQDASTADLPINGVCLYECNPANPITSLQVKGTGTLQYAAFGDL